MGLKQRFMKIQPLIAISSILITILVISIISFTLLKKFNDVLEAQVIENAKIKMEQLEVSIETQMEDMIKDCVYIEDMIIDNNGLIDSYIENQLNTMFTSSKNIIAISLFDQHGMPIKAWPSYEVRDDFVVKDTQWFSNVMDETTLYYFDEPSLGGIYKDNYTRTLGVCTKIIKPGARYNKEIILRLDVSFSKLAGLFKETAVGEKGYLYMVGASDDVIYHPEQQILFSGDTQEQTLMYIDQIGDSGYVVDEETQNVISKISLNYVEWDIVGVAFSDDVNFLNSEIAQYILWVLLLAICITVLFSWFISNKISDPVTHLEKSMRKVTAGDLNTRIYIESGESEVVALTESFNHMVSRIQNLIKENQKEHELKRKTELEALQSQINPHFLYNTLDSIVWMAETEHKDEVITMVNALANFFRISISDGKGIIKLRDEIRHAKNYMLIQKNRYTDKFEYETHADESLLELMVPKLMVQPLLENALYHGMEYLMDVGKIVVTAEADEKYLYVRVSDNGVGMDEETLKNILEEKRDKRNGIGVKNVNERIKLIFGQEYGLFYESEIEVGTTVTIKLPKISYEVDANEK
jgi:two-component system, sensor histidine kinase YesM